MTAKPAILALDKIRTDGGTQSRAKLSDDAIDDYAQRYTDRADMDPVVAFYDGKDYWLADGFHRHMAARKAGRPTIGVDVRQGTQRDAILYSVGANATGRAVHRSNADKRRAVMMLLRDEEWSQKSDRWIARACAVSNQSVSNIRGELSKVDSSTPAVRVGQDGKTRKLPEKKPVAKTAPPPSNVVDIGKARGAAQPDLYGAGSMDGSHAKAPARATSAAEPSEEPEEWSAGDFKDAIEVTIGQWFAEWRARGMRGESLVVFLTSAVSLQRKIDEKARSVG